MNYQTETASFISHIIHIFMIRNYVNEYYVEH